MLYTAQPRLHKTSSKWHLIIYKRGRTQAVVSRGRWGRAVLACERRKVTYSSWRSRREGRPQGVRVSARKGFPGLGEKPRPVAAYTASEPPSLGLGTVSHDHKSTCSEHVSLQVGILTCLFSVHECPVVFFSPGEGD